MWIHPDFRLITLQVVYLLAQLECGLYRVQGGFFHRAVFFSLASPLAVCTALVNLVLHHQIVQLQIHFFVWDVTSDSPVNPGNDFLRVSFADDRSIFYPQKAVIMWSLTHLILLLDEVVLHLSQNFIF